MLLMIKRKYFEHIIDTDSITHIRYSNYEDRSGIRHFIVDVCTGNSEVSIPKKVFEMSVKPHIHSDFIEVLGVNGKEIFVNKRYIKLIYRELYEANDTTKYIIYLKGSDHYIDVVDIPDWKQIVASTTVINIEKNGGR